MNYIGVDLGGINTAVALVSEDGRVLERHSRPTPRGSEAVVDGIAAAVVQVLSQAGQGIEQVGGIGVGSPGTIDTSTGVVEYWSNLDFRHVPLADMLRERLGRPVLLENDANCAALGEYAAGAGKGSRSLVIITLGTGVGGGAVLDGRLYSGFNNAGLEVGHMVIEYNGRPCTCGRRGCFEAYCSATALIKQARLAMQRDPDTALWRLAGDPEGVNAKLVFDAMAQGDACAAALVEEYVNYLGSGVATLVNLFQPEVFCIGGGVAGAGEALFTPVREILEREDYARFNSRRTRLMRAQLGNDAGIIGAAMLHRYS